MARPSSSPWLYIPLAAQAGQIHAFADREQPLIHLYRSMVDAGNQVRQGQQGIRKKMLVHGYMGVGKSALILQALKLLRGDIQFGPVDPEGTGEPPLQNGQRIAWSNEIPAPLDIQRWLVLRFSGKQLAGISALPDALQRRVAEEEARSESAETGVRSELGGVLMGLASDVAAQADRQKKRALDLPILHYLLRSDEVRLYEAVQSALRQLRDVIDYVKRWEGGRQTDAQKSTTKLDSARDVEAGLTGQLGKKFSELSVDSQAALKVAANIIYKNSYLTENTSQVEKSWRVGAQVVVDVLNSFFEATDAANLPTILVLDDFDEFASSMGPSHEARARVLSWIIGPITCLKPTVLVIALRGEYMMEDVLRQYDAVMVPPMDRASALLAIDAWTDVQEPQLSATEGKRLRDLTDMLLSPLPPDAPLVIPFRMLQIVVWLANNTVGQASPQAAFDLLKRYLGSVFPYGVTQTVLRAIASLSNDDLLRCAAAEPLPGELFSLSERERRELAKAGLLRPAMAGDPSNTDVILDPLCAFLRAAQLSQASQPIAPAQSAKP